MEEEKKVYTAKHTIVPTILLEWNNTCGLPEGKESAPVKLTDENAHKYTELSSNVGWKGRVDYALNHLEKDSDMDPSFLSFLLESVISTVLILTTTGQPPPDDYLICTQLFLRAVRNEFGESPPNVAAFLEYLKIHSSPDVLAALELIEDPDNQDVNKNLVITQVPKAVQQRVSK